MKKDTAQQTLLFFAIFLTLWIMLQWFRPAPSKPPAEDVETAREQSDDIPDEAYDENGEIAEPPEEAEPPPAPETPARAIADIRVARDVDADGEIDYIAEFTTRGAALRRFVLPNYYITPAHKRELVLLDELEPGRLSLVLDRLGSGKDKPVRLRDIDYHLLSAPRWMHLEEKAPRNDGDELVFQATVAAWRIRKIYDFGVDRRGSEPRNRYGFRLRLQLRNLAEQERDLSYTLVGIAGIVPDQIGRGIWASRWTQLMGVSGELTGPETATLERSALSELKDEERLEHNKANIAWLGLTNRFFAAVLVLEDPKVALAAQFKPLAVREAYAGGEEELAALLAAHPQNGAAVLETNAFDVAPGQTLSHDYAFYGGPMADETVAFDPRLRNLVSYSFERIAFISRFLLQCLNYIAVVVGNYGLAIILLTLLVKTCLHPLTRKGLASSHKMQLVQPLLKEIREKYKDDRQKQGEAQMELFRKHGISPVGGCLPMLLQLPIFISLYGAFARGFPIRQQAFLWIDDLSQPDRLLGFGGWQVPYFQWTSLNLLPVIYLGLQILQMNLQPKSTDPQQQQTQQMMKFMPFVFVFIFYDMPSALVLYFVVQSGYTLVEHYLIKRALKRQPLAAADGAPAPAAADPQAAAAGTGISHGGKKKKKKKR